jgi:hypothetical protein
VNPAPRSTLDDPEHWRERAEKARAVAEKLSNPTAKAAMLSIAEQYERQGEDARQRVAKNDHGDG